jgi:hypothetical protein
MKAAYSANVASPRSGSTPHHDPYHGRITEPKTLRERAESYTGLRGNGSEVKAYIAGHRSGSRLTKAERKVIDLFPKVAFSLGAAITFLEQSDEVAKRAVGSNKMFDQILADYRARLGQAAGAWQALRSKKVRK